MNDELRSYLAAYDAGLRALECAERELLRLGATDNDATVGRNQSFLTVQSAIRKMRAERKVNRAFILHNYSRTPIVCC